MEDFQQIDAIYSASEINEIDQLSTHTLEVSPQEPVIIRGSGSTTLYVQC